LPPELDRAALSLAVGQVSDPVKAGEQWYVLTVENIVPPLQKSFEEVKEEIKTLSGNQIFVERYRALVDEIYGAADIRFDPGYDPGHKTESSTQP
jgi:parvulin-like peptidyl-prolyl isomerase